MGEAGMIGEKGKKFSGEQKRKDGDGKKKGIIVEEGCR